MTLGRAAFDRGALEDAAAHWQQAAQAYAAAHDARHQVEALVNLGIAYQTIGQHRLAIETLQSAVGIAANSGQRAALIQAQSNLGGISTCGQERTAGERHLRESLALAQANHDEASAALILNNLATVLAAQGKIDDALAAFDQSATVARQKNNHLLTAKATSNAAALAAQAQRAAEAEKLNAAALTAVRQLPATHEQAFLVLRCGQTAAQLARADDAEAAYRDAFQIAEQLGDKRAATYALGFLGQLAETQQHVDQALALTRHAAFIAREIQLADAAYRWDWQIGRLLGKQNDRAGAIAAYRRALLTLQTIRHDLSAGSAGAGGPRASFRETVGPVYFELADLLLQQASAATAAAAQPLLREARDTVEQLKASELEDYLQDECQQLLRTRTAQLDRLARNTAVLYVIPLPQRTELLVSLAAGIRQFQVPVGADQLTAQVRQFRLNVEKRTTNQYLRQARQLYQWLIAPVKAALVEQGIETLVVVPDGALRTIPFAALNDGEHFLIEQFATVTSPGLTLLAPAPMPRDRLQVFAGGLTEAAQNFPELPHVGDELQTVHRLFHGPLLVNENFCRARIQGDFARNQFQIVHFATHGQFGKDSGESFLLTHDGKLTLDDLEQLLRPTQARGKPVELLVLSACQSAAGDDRAALGLAGVAVKAGARSALATLWFVQDESTALVVAEFYNRLRGDKVSKAQALQQAQLKLLQDPRYDHPGYWAAFLLIGNWL